MTEKEFRDNIRSKASGILTAWADYVKVGYYGNDPYAKRKYGLHAYHKWGSLYCSWEGHKQELIEMLRENGATNISGKVTWNRVELYFDPKKRVEKEWGNA